MTEQQKNEYLIKDMALLARENLSLGAKGLNLFEISNELLENSDFFNASGSSNSNKHHYGTHGLILHTHEVFANGASFITTNKNLYRFSPVDLQVFFLSALFHDSGKMYDYKLVDGVWVVADHKRKIHHISRSALLFSEAAKKHGFDRTDDVLHAILSHHGKREYGSPVRPQTKVAWLLHLCDSLSARMYDCDTLNYDKYN